MIAEIIQAGVVALVLLLAAGYAFTHLAPRGTAQVRLAVGHAMAREGRPRWVRRLGRRWMRAARAAGCDQCSACPSCGPERRKIKVHRQLHP